jgi:hypothetical protein
MPGKSRWSAALQTTAASSGTYTIKAQQTLKVLGWNWAAGGSAASSVYFRIIADGSTVVADACGARLSGYAADPDGLGVTAQNTITFGFTASAAGAQSYFVWGEIA